MKGDERENLEVSLGCQELFTPNKRRCRTQTCRQQRPSLGAWPDSPACLYSAGCPQTAVLYGALTLYWALSDPRHLHA